MCFHRAFFYKSHQPWLVTFQNKMSFNSLQLLIPITKFMNKFMLMDQVPQHEKL